MTEGSTTDKRWSPTLRNTFSTVALLAAGTAMIGMAACDTVAQLSFSDRNFRAVQPVGMVAQGGQCGGISGDATMRMVFVDDSDEPIKPGEEVALAFVEPDQDDISFSDGAMYTLPDVDCSGDSDCSRLRCRSTPSDDIGQRCQDDTGISATSDPLFVGTEPQSQAIAFGMSNVGRWRGWGSSNLSQYYALNEDGPNDQLDSGPVDGLAVDSAGDRFSALRDMARNWRILSRYVGNDGRSAQFGFWLFGEAPAEVSSLVVEGSPSSSMWTDNPSHAEGIFSGMDPVESGRSDVYSSIREVLDLGFVQSDAVADAEHRSLVFLVSGYDERKRDNINYNNYPDLEQGDLAGAVIAKANELDVEVSIVQVDAPRDRELLRDDWVYYENDDPCTDDSECKNFETCREPTLYVEDATTNDRDDVVEPGEEQRDQTFCLPDYDENGRVGPIADYDRIACETGGSYSYVPLVSRSMIHNPLEGMVLAPEAAWEVDLSIADFDRLDPHGDGAGEAHLLESSLEVTIGRTNRVLFEQDGSADTRRPFFTPDN